MSQEENIEEDTNQAKPPKFESKYWISNEEISKLGIDDLGAERFRRKHYQDSFRIETWVDEFINHDRSSEIPLETFFTTFVDIKYKEAVVLNKLYKNNLFSGSTVTKTAQELQKFQLNQEEEQILTELEKRLDVEVFEGKYKNIFKKGAFMKLSTRSPKDAPVLFGREEKFINIVKEEFQSYVNKKKTKIELLEPEEIIVLITKAFSKCLKITSGKDAIYLLSRSRRVYEDLEKNLEFGEEHFVSNLIIREWIDEVIENPQYEFRCFVHKKQLNAVSQYFCDTKFDDLRDSKDRKVLEDRLIKFYNQVKDRLEHESFVIDFYISETSAYIIELNPFHTGAGACLFSWKNDRDLFMNGPLQFRYQDKILPSESLSSILPLVWEKYLVKELGVVINNDKYKTTKEKGETCIVQ